MILEKISDIVRDFRKIYGYKKIIKLLFIAFLISCPSLFLSDSTSIKSIYTSTLSFFTALIVIEIAFFGIFFSANKNNELAKKKIVNKEEHISYYQSLLVKNYHSISIKFGTIFFIYLAQMYNIINYSKTLNLIESINLKINLGTYYIFYFLAIYSILVTIELVTSVYYFLWRS